MARTLRIYPRPYGGGVRRPYGRAPVIKKIIPVPPNSIKIKRIIDGVPHVLKFTVDDNIQISPFFRHYFNPDSNVYMVHNISDSLRIYVGGDFRQNEVGQFWHLAEGETATDEPIDAEFVYTETGPFYARRVKPSLTKVARAFANNFNHSLPHLRGRSRNICHDLQPSEVHEREELKRYDNAANYWKMLLGYLWKKVDAFEHGIIVLTPETKAEDRLYY